MRARRKTSGWSLAAGALVNDPETRWHKTLNRRFMRPGPSTARGLSLLASDRNFMTLLYRAIAPVTLLASLVGSASAGAQPPSDPFSFFEGVTESVGTLKVVMHKSVWTRSVGRGQMRPDGSLSLVQRVEDEGRPPYVRRWVIKQVAPGRFVGTMSQATGPVTIDEIGDRFRFRLQMTGGLSVEQWLTPLPGGRSATSSMTVRKFGIAVASSQGTVRKVS
jgi:hypothetical protein